MKTKLNFIWIICIVLLSGCAKESDCVSLSATIDGYESSDGSKLYINDDNYACWNDGDSIWVNGGEAILRISGDAALIGGVPYSESGYVAVYPSSIVDDNRVKGLDSIGVKLPIVQTFLKDDNDRQIIEAPMIAYCSATGEGLEFKNLCSLVRVAITNNGSSDLRVRGIRISLANASVCGEGVVSVANPGVPSLRMGQGQPHSVLLAMPDVEKISSNSSKEYYIVVPPFSDQKFAMTVLTDKEGVISSRIQEKSDQVFFDRNVIYRIPFEMSSASDNVLPCGRYSVSSDQKVLFSMGNLQYQSDQWRFAEQQQNSSNVFHSGLFVWASGSSPSATGSRGPSSGTINNTEYDWGHNAIANGGGVSDQWHTMTQEEWQYLLGLNGWAKAVVNNVKGLILFPDNWTLPEGMEPIVNLGVGTVGYESNKYSLSEWRLMELNGALFLPVTGYYSGSGVTNADNGYYWSATAVSGEMAYAMLFSVSKVSGADKTRTLGYAVRLVKTIQ